MNNDNGTEQNFIFRVRRFDPEKDTEPYYQDFTVPCPPGMVVLDGLWYIKENLDPSLAWRSSCRMGVCGSCGMLLNGQPHLACHTQVREVAKDVLLVAPLPNFDIVRDLVPDLGPMLDKHRALNTHIIRENLEEQMEPTDQYWQSPEELVSYLQFAYCIKCGCCMAACPTLATDDRYSGPMPLAQGYRYLVDTRDDAFKERAKQLSGEEGPWRCHYAGECSAACPKGVDPARAIQLMKRQLVWDYLRLSKRRHARPADLLPRENRATESREGIPEAPEFTIEGAKSPAG
jgi:succinate dehydrogenase / fumarate reductase iron-sulfur subunit